MNPSAAHHQAVLEVFHCFKVDIAVTGESGTGKSSLVNAFLGLNHDEQGAPTGVVETTMEPTMYQHPKLPHLRVWDLPGMGTPSFKSKSYVKKMNFDLYDMFVIVDSVRVKEKSLYLAGEIRKRNRPFYFVRSKVDHDVVSESKKYGFVESTVMERIRKECVYHLETIAKQPQVFLVSTHVTEKYDLRRLIETLEGDLPLLRKKAFCLFLETICHKTKTLLKLVEPPAFKRKKISRDDVQRMRAVYKCCSLSKGLTRQEIVNVIDAGV